MAWYRVRFGCTSLAFERWSEVGERERERPFFAPIYAVVVFSSASSSSSSYFRLHLCWAAWHVVHILATLIRLLGSFIPTIVNPKVHIIFINYFVNCYYCYDDLVFFFFFVGRFKFQTDALHSIKCSCDCFISVHFFSFANSFSSWRVRVCVVVMKALKTMADCDHYLILTLLLQQYVSSQVPFIFGCLFDNRFGDDAELLLFAFCLYFCYSSSSSFTNPII